ncbi:MAG: hypothetical protein QNK04_17965 [Myxococcota bacterium]|nr:hypothetical protein [Myxococcota bacterium]
MSRATALSTALVLALLPGCTNSIYFYETEKISFTAEARPDSSQPIQGNLGVKQRVAVVAPPTRQDPEGEEKRSGAKHVSEAASMIASFRFAKTPGGLLDIGPIDIHTALITGEAAQAVSDAPQAEAVALAIAAAPPISTRDALVDEILRDARAADQLARLAGLTAKDFGALTPDERAELGRLTRTGSAYEKTLHDALRKEMAR